jgi:7,8-dihydro-6-hydroxymethylpterin dimethyltransferase
MQLRDHSFLGTTQSLCPECLTLVSAKIIERAGRVYFRKRCPTHGVRDDFVCSDVSQYDRMEYNVPGKMPAFGVEPDRGCPYDCGLCTEHEQHTCLGLLEITSNCNLTCPMCFAASGPGGKHLTIDQCRVAIDRLVLAEGRPEVLQLSGGEPTIHPDFLEVLDYGLAQPIDVVMINTNGVRLAHDIDFVRALAARGPRVEVYLQFDGFRESTNIALRGVPLAEIKQRAIDNLGRHGVRVTLVTTLQGGVNDDEVGAIVRFGLERPFITGVSFQPATYSGRHVLPEQLERRVTFPDVIRAIAEQTDGLFRTSDFLPLPCAHPNCHSLTYVYRGGGAAVPLTRFIDAHNHPDLLANGIMFTRPRARELIERYLAKLACGGDCGCGPVSLDFTAGKANASGSLTVLNDPRATSLPMPPTDGAAVADFFRRALDEQLSTADVFRVTITSFLDAYNFDIRRLMKCCVHHLLPSGHIIPFCAYNVLYRDGHVPLPTLRALGAVQPSAGTTMVNL